MKRLREEAGSSLLEVLVAMSLFAVVAGGLAAATITSIRANGTSANVTAATTLIYDQFDKLRALDPSTAPAALSAGDHADPNNPLTARGATGGKFERTWTVTPNLPRPGIAEVVVRVSWAEQGERVVQSVAFVCTSATCS
jgi:Tfp pilus assembly protein PilV